MSKSYRDLLTRGSQRRSARSGRPRPELAAERGALLVDVREASEWEQGHIDGAHHVAKSYVEQDIESVAPDREAPVVLYCAGGIRSLFAGPDARRHGLSRTWPR